MLDGLSLNYLAEASAASNVMRGYLTPAIATICVLAGLASVFFIVMGGMRYMTSAGQPDKLDQAKRILKNALVGLVLVLAAASLTAILSHAYGSPAAQTVQNLPSLHAIEQPKDNLNIFDVVVKAVIKFLQQIVESAAKPFLEAISYFVNATPLMGDNSSVFNLWLAIVGIADVLFIAVVALLGFQVMSYAALGLDEIEVKHLLPQFAVIFLVMNTSIFAIDAVISLSNAMIHALQSGFASTDIWQLLANLTNESNQLGLVGLLMMVALLVLTVMLLVYYVLRLVALYIGAILSPLVAMLWLLPAFKDFAIQALKTYLTLVFVLFVHAVIMLLAASIFTGADQVGTSGQPNTLMALIVGMATVIALLKTQGVMQQLSYAASAPRAARELTSSFVRSASAANRTARSTFRTSKAVGGAAKRSVQKATGGQLKQDSFTPRKTVAAQNNAGGRSKPSKPSKPLKTGEVSRAPKRTNIGKDNT